LRFINGVNISKGLHMGQKVNSYESFTIDAIGQKCL